LKPSRIVANVTGMMIFVQVILGGASTLLNLDIGIHIVWGILTFVVLVVASVLAIREYGRGSTVFRVAAVAIVDYVVQGVLGLGSFNSDSVVVVHLANAFILGILVSYLISFQGMADRGRQPSAVPAAPAATP
jgi:heme A synthase